jgi:hypothetical protein
MKIKVSHHYRDIAKHNDQYDFGTIVIGDLTTNALTFPAVPGGLAALTGINNTYLVKINAAEGGDHAAIVARDNYRDTVWIPAFDEVADYVDEVADGDEDTILLSGFKPTKGAKEEAGVPKQMHLELKSPNTGTLQYKSDTENVGKDATYFLVGKTKNVATLTQDADGKIIIETTGPCKIVFAPVRTKKGLITGMPSEEIMEFVIGAVNAAGVGPVSSEQKIIIQ